MGNARWDAADYATYSMSAGISAKSSAREVFTRSDVDSKFMPSTFINKRRESKISEANPNPTPVIFGVDFTGSMGEYAARITTECIPALMTNMVNNRLVEDPHMLLMGIGDPRASDMYPLQATQFEADLRIIEQTRDLYVEGRGGGNNEEGYDQAWYFASFCTDVDAFKNGRRGIIFTFGDEMPPQELLTKQQFDRMCGFTASTEKFKEYASVESMSNLLERTQQNWDVFHVVIECGSYCRNETRRNSVREAWTQLLGTKALFATSADSILPICETVLKLNASANPFELMQDIARNQTLAYAFSNLLNKHNGWQQ